MPVGVIAELRHYIPAPARRSRCFFGSRTIFKRFLPFLSMSTTALASRKAFIVPTTLGQRIPFSFWLLLTACLDTSHLAAHFRQSVGQSFDLAGHCAELPQFLSAAFSQTGCDGVLVHVDLTTAPINNFRNDPLICCHSVLSYSFTLLCVLLPGQGWNIKFVGQRANMISVYLVRS